MERLTNRIKQLDKDDLIVYTKGKYEDTVLGEMSHDDIRAVLKKLAYYEDAEEEREQLDKALNELKRRREYDGYLLGSGIVESAYSSGYKKAVDDLLKNANEMSTEVSMRNYSIKAIGIGLLEQIAEQLKEGVVDEYSEKKLEEFRNKKKQEEQTMKQKLNRNDFKPGNTVEFAGQKWNVLAQVSENNFLCVNNGIIDHKEFDEDNNNWSVSSLRKYLNGEYLQNFSGLELIPWTQDLTTDDGLKDYGSSTDLIFLLTDNQYRAYRQYMRRVDDWWWLITADSPINHYVRGVLSDGTLSSHNAYIGNNGVRPACVIHLKSREEKEMKSYENGYKKMNKQIIKDAIKFHGADEQTTVCMEECAELIQAISKEKRGKHDKQHLIEEIADVYICLEMLMEIYNISSKEIESMIERKQQREIERMCEQK